MFHCLRVARTHATGDAHHIRLQPFVPLQTQLFIHSKSSHQHLHRQFCFLVLVGSCLDFDRRSAFVATCLCASVGVLIRSARRCWRVQSSWVCLPSSVKVFADYVFFLNKVLCAGVPSRSKELDASLLSNRPPNDFHDAGYSRFVA